MKSIRWILMIALASSLNACSPKTNEIKPIVGANTVTYKGLSFTKTSDEPGFLKMRDGELLKAVKEKKLTVPEAQAFLRSEKRRIGFPDPNHTPGFDAELRKAGLLK
jgi:hypothetical protein